MELIMWTFKPSSDRFRSSLSFSQEKLGSRDYKDYKFQVKQKQE